MRRATKNIARLSALAVVAAPASAVVANRADATTGAYQFLFLRNDKHGDSTNGRLVLHTGLNGIGDWRAGSGMGSAYNECQRNYGRIPGGTYSIVAWPGNHTGAVQGPAMQLSDHACYDGKTMRTELFIHSSYPWSWSHYHSEGCVKLESTGTPSSAGGDIRDAWNAGNFVGQPANLVVTDEP